MKGLVLVLLSFAVLSAFGQPESFQADTTYFPHNAGITEASLYSNYISAAARRGPVYGVKAMPFNSRGMDFSPFPYRNGIIFVSSRSKKGGEQTGEETFLNLLFTTEGEDGSFSEPEPLDARGAPCAVLLLTYEQI